MIERVEIDKKYQCYISAGFLQSFSRMVSDKVSAGVDLDKAINDCYPMLLACASSGVPVSAYKAVLENDVRFYDDACMGELFSASFNDNDVEKYGITENTLREKLLTKLENHVRNRNVESVILAVTGYEINAD
ncbi:hypothetical protein HDU85_005894 [Gaertneriomyces sp. JEL0708]|nr:hypothetical protein HDU85_005894 [Gaertneriomyces sp. JEL0708]